jgi:hypothetical protein
MVRCVRRGPRALSRGSIRSRCCWRSQLNARTLGGRPMETLDFDLDAGDDIQYVHIVRPIMVGALRVLEPRRGFVVKVDQWFGPRWMYFSHKTLGALGIGYYDLRVPPFVPNRVVSETYYERQSAVLRQAKPPLTLHIKQSSSKNATRKLSELCSDAALFGGREER